MKKILSILLSLVVLASICTVPVLAAEGDKVEYISADAGMKIVGGPVQNTLGLYDILNSENATAVNFGQSGERDYCKVWFAIDLLEEKTVSGINLTVADTTGTKFGAYLTNSVDIWSRVYVPSDGSQPNYGKVLSDETIALLEADNAKVSTLDTGWTERVTGTDHSLEFPFEKQEKGRYLFIVVEKAVVWYNGIMIKNISVYGGDVNNSVTDVMSSSVGVKASRAYNLSYVKTLDGFVDDGEGNLTRNTNYSCTFGNWNNASYNDNNNIFIAFDIGASKDVVGLDIYHAAVNVSSLDVYATNDSTVYSALGTGNCKSLTNDQLANLASSKVASATVANRTPDSYETARDSIVFADGNVNARYIFIVVTAVNTAPWNGSDFDYVAINCAKSGIENIAVSEWTEGGKVTYTANVVNMGTQNARPVVVYEAQKDSTGKLLTLTSVERTLDANEGRTFSDEITLVNGATRVEFFIVDKNAFAPLTKKYYNYSE